MPTSGSRVKFVFCTSSKYSAFTTKDVNTLYIVTDTQMLYIGSTCIGKGNQTSVSGNAGTATKLATPRTLTIGSTGKNFNGSGNVSWSASEIGFAKAITGISRSGTTFTYTCIDGSTGTFSQQDNNTWYAMKGASSSAAGTAGYVPAAKAGQQNYFLRGDGTWSAISVTHPVTSVNSKTGAVTVSLNSSYNSSTKALTLSVS